MPSGLVAGDERHGDQDESEASREQERAADVKVVKESLNCCTRGLVLHSFLFRPLCGEQAHPFGFPAVHEQAQSQREKRDGQDDGPHRVAHAPGRVGEDGGSDGGTNPHGHKKGAVGEAGEEGTIQEVAGVGDEHLLQDLQACRSGRVEDLSRRIGLDVL